MNNRIRLIICRRCELAIIPEYLCSHLWKKHKIFCSTETQQTLSESHSLISMVDIAQFREETNVLEFPIDGIPIEDGYRCLQCGHYMMRSEAMRRHLQSHSRVEDDSPGSEKCKIQSPFGGTLKKCFGLVDHRRVTAPRDNDTAWDILSLKLGRKRARLSTQKEENLRFMNSFVARTRWDILVEDHDWKKLKDIAAMPKSGTTLHCIIRLVYKHFGSISDKLRMGDVLMRRKITSTGYEKSY